MDSFVQNRLIRFDMEEHFFFENEGVRIFGVLHHPQAKSDGGLVFCYPFAEERQEAHRVLVNFARNLAQGGFSVLRFDYRGTGDSEGDFGDYDFHSRIKDILRAIEVIKEKTAVRKLGLFGLRLGATLAILAAKEVGEVHFMVLWEPILNIKAYLHQFLRKNLAIQLATYKEIKVTREELINQLLKGEKVNVEGYWLSGGFYTQAIEVDPLRDYPLDGRPSLIIQISKTQSISDPLQQKLLENALKHPKSEYCPVDEEPFWVEKKYYIPDSNPLFEKTIEWVRSIR